MWQSQWVKESFTFNKIPFYLFSLIFRGAILMEHKECLIRFTTKIVYWCFTNFLLRLSHCRTILIESIKNIKKTAFCIRVNLDISVILYFLTNKLHIWAHLMMWRPHIIPVGLLDGGVLCVLAWICCTHTQSVNKFWTKITLFIFIVIFINAYGLYIFSVNFFLTFLYFLWSLYISH